MTRINNYNVIHICSTDNGSSGSPILNLKNNKVIGIHKGTPDCTKNFNYGTLLKYPLNDFINTNKTKNNYKNKNNEKDGFINKNIINIAKNDSINKYKIKNNYINEGDTKNDFFNKNKTINHIIGEIYINNNNINKNIRIVNSYENWKRENHYKDWGNDYLYENEKEIKENIEIKINEKIIEFTYYYKFKEKGKYIIEYSFKNNLTKTNFMFNGCNSLKYLNLSNFNTQNVTDMSSMFLECRSLVNLNLSNFNTQNVTDMPQSPIPNPQILAHF